VASVEDQVAVALNYCLFERGHDNDMTYRFRMVIIGNLTKQTDNII